MIDNKMLVDIMEKYILSEHIKNLRGYKFLNGVSHFFHWTESWELWSGDFYRNKYKFSVKDFLPNNKEFKKIPKKQPRARFFSLQKNLSSKHFCIRKNNYYFGTEDFSIEKKEVLRTRYVLFKKLFSKMEIFFNSKR